MLLAARMYLVRSFVSYWFKYSYLSLKTTPVHRQIGGEGAGHEEKRTVVLYSATEKHLQKNKGINETKRKYSDRKNDLKK